MKHTARLLSVLCVAIASRAKATFQTWRIESAYSNAENGGVQSSSVLRESGDLDGERFLLAGRNLTSTHAEVAPHPHVSLRPPRHCHCQSARPGWTAPGLGSPPDQQRTTTMPAQFLPTDGGTLDYAGVDQMIYGALPNQRPRSDEPHRLDLAGGGCQFRRRGRDPSGAAGDLHEVCQHGTRPLLHHRPRARYQHPRHRPDTGVVADRTVLRGLPGSPTRVRRSNPVCDYIPPAHGNSHFFSASPAECAAIDARIGTDPNYSGYILESPAAFYVGLPDTTTGACPPGWLPVYRLWNQRADSNHRYTTDVAVKAQMITKAYVPEGYGPSATIMCAPAGGSASLHFLQGSAAPNGALVSDAASIPAASYQGYATPTATAEVGPRSGAGEVIAFSARRAVTVQPASFSTLAGDQVVDVALLPELGMPVTIWVVAGPFANSQQTALTLWSTVQQIYRDERFGVSFRSRSSMPPPTPRPRHGAHSRAARPMRT